jgi:tetratricopeptide (TPR) repeat protein
VEAVAQQGRTDDALKRMDTALAAAGRLASLQVSVLLKSADIHWRFLKNPAEASRLYEKITTEHRGLEVPAVREAAIHWGDLFTETGDLVQASERYKLAKTLGGEVFAATGQTEAIQRGAQLRIAEQKLKSGDVRGTRLLLEKIELNFPEQKLEGLFRLMRAETERMAGRYDEAVDHYEVLLRLRQWSGFRDRAIHGLADCACRRQDFKTAADWYEKLRDSFPDYFESQKLQPVLALARERADHGSQGETFGGFSTDFETEQSVSDPKNPKLVFAPGLGIDGPTVVTNRFVYQKNLHHFPLGNSCWVEFWYRKPLNSIVGYSMNLQLYSGSEISPANKTLDMFIGMDRSAYGQWRKAAALVQTPKTKDALLWLGLVWNQGAVHVDGLKILPVSDRENDSLRNFIESGDAEP